MPATVLLLGRGVLDQGHWGLFWVALAALCAVMLRRLSLPARGLLAVLLGQVALLGTVPYVFAPGGTPLISLPFLCLC